MSDANRFKTGHVFDRGDRRALRPGPILIRLGVVAVGLVIVTGLTGCDDSVAADSVVAAGDGRDEAGRTARRESASPAAPAVAPAVVTDDEVNQPFRIEPPLMDLGSVQAGSTLEIPIQLVNSTGSAIRVERAKSGCGCTVIDVPRDPIPAGGSIKSTVKLRVSVRIGRPISKRVTFIPEGDLPPAEVRITAVAEELISIDNITNDAKSLGETRLALRSVDDTPFRVLGSEPPDALAILPTARASEHTLVLTDLVGNTPASRPSIELRLDHPRVPQLRIPLRRGPGNRPVLSAGHSNRPSSLQIRPQRPSFGTITAGESSPVRLVLKGIWLAEGEEPDLALESDGLSAELIDIQSTEAGSALRIELRSAPDAVGRVEARMKVSIGCQRGSVSVCGTIKPPADAALSAVSS